MVGHKISANNENGIKWQRELWPISNATANTGPQKLLDGSFLFLESSWRKPGDRAMIFSPVYESNESKNACVSLNYNMNGVTMGDLKLWQSPEGINQ